MSVIAAPRRRDAGPRHKRGESARLHSDNERLRLENARLAANNERLVGENERLAKRTRTLEARVEELRRAAKRQAAPFSKGEPKAKPRRAGRKPGKDYGRKARRAAPDHIDEVVRVELPDACPDCGGEIEFERFADQYQQDIPPAEPHTCHRRIAIGRCKGCSRRVQARHPGQTSDALGAAASQIGPRAVALAAQLNKEYGLPVSKVSRVLFDLCGLKVTPGGLHQALARAATASRPTYDALICGIRGSPAVAADETGWRVGGQRNWLWDFVGDQITVYLIAPGRGYDQAAQILGPDFAGVIERDGWAPYRRFAAADHQSCLAHLLRRCGELIADSRAGQARVPHTVRRLLGEALELRTRRDQGVISAHELAGGVACLKERTDKLLCGHPTHPPNRRLVAHLRNERSHLFTFLTTPGVEATNWRAEQGLRPAVCNRKHWGGNRTWRGAEVQQVLMSVIRTARQQEVDPVALLTGLQRSPEPFVASELTIPARRVNELAAP